MQEAIDVGLDKKLCTDVDMLLCNNEVVFHHVSMGNMHGFDFFEENDNDSLIDQMKRKLKYFQTMKYMKFTFKTAKISDD